MMCRPVLQPLTRPSLTAVDQAGGPRYHSELQVHCNRGRLQDLPLTALLAVDFRATEANSRWRTVLLA